MPLGLHAKIDIAPQSILSSRWTHDMANVFCRARLKLDLDWRTGRLARRPEAALA